MNFAILLKDSLNISVQYVPDIMAEHLNESQPNHVSDHLHQPHPVFIIPTISQYNIPPGRPPAHSRAGRADREAEADRRRGGRGQRRRRQRRDSTAASRGRGRRRAAESHGHVNAGRAAGAEVRMECMYRVVHLVAEHCC